MNKLRAKCKDAHQHQLTAMPVLTAVPVQNMQVVVVNTNRIYPQTPRGQGVNKWVNPQS